MPDFRNLWRGERNGSGEKAKNGHKHAEEARAATEPESGDFRYRPERGRHRYPEGLYSGVSRGDASARRHAEPLRARRDDDEPQERAGALREERERPEYRRAEFRRPDYDGADHDREIEEEEESWPQRHAPPEELPSGPHRGRGPRGYRRSDERIREDVCDRLTDDPEIDASDIEVLVANGEVTLNGSVDSRLIRRLAEDLADAVSGVTLVQNNLKIGAR
jgi:hypothetical protein